MKRLYADGTRCLFSGAAKERNEATVNNTMMTKAYDTTQERSLLAAGSTHTYAWTPA